MTTPASHTALPPEASRIRPGLCSITFRALDVAGVVSVAAQAELEGIEWGGDVHVPPGHVAAAREAARQTRDAGLAVSSYGSYYRAGAGEGEGEEVNSQPFEAVLASAQELGAPVVRVWAGPPGGLLSGEAYRAAVPDETVHEELWHRVVSDLERLAALARTANIRIGLEHHPHTLTATAQGAMRLLSGLSPAAREMVGCYWQPNQFYLDDAERWGDFESVLPALLHVHVFQWEMKAGETDRRPLAEGEELWRTWLTRAANTGPSLPFPRYALLEFVRDDDPARLQEDAVALRRMLGR